MPVYLSPGVYIEEIPSGSKPIEGVSTSTAAFIGAARRGPSGEAVLIHSLDEYRGIYGEISSADDSMGLAVRAFYLNGGKDAYICRLVSDDPPTAAASSSLIGEATSGSAKVLTVKAGSVGVWGNDLYVRVIKPDKDALAFDLEVGHHEGDKFVRDEAFSGLTMDALEERYALTQVNGKSRFVVLALEPAGDPDHGSEQYQDAVLTGGAVATGFEAPLATGAWQLTLNINGLGAKQISLVAADFAAGGGAVGDRIATAIQSKIRALGTDPAYQNFQCALASSRFTLTSPKANARNKSSASVVVYDWGGTTGNLASVLRLDSKARATLRGAVITAPVVGAIKAAIDGVAGALALTLNIDGRGTVTVTLDKPALALAGTSHVNDGNAVARAIRDAVRALDPRIPSYRDFECIYQVDGADSRFVLTSGSSLSRTSSIASVGGLLAAPLSLATGTAVTGRQYDDSTHKVIPKQVLGTLDQGDQLAGGGEAKAAAADFGSFFNTILRKRRDASILLLPGQTWAADGSGNAYISEALAHCEATKSRMVIIDPPTGVELEQAAQVDQMGLPTSTYAVMYYPWVKVANPLYDEEKNPTAAKTLAIAPSPFAAGMWARIDGTRGVWKAPAGVEAQLGSIAGLQYTVEEGEQDQLNPLGINCIRKLPGFGSVIWGSRTLSTKANPEWRYVPVRRTAIFIERSIYEGIQWAVFEPNDHPLWSALRTNIESFMNGLFRAGAFQGAKTSDAYFVRCGLGDTMTQGDIDRGQVIVIVGFAPLKPAEFVIVRIQQKVGQQ